MVPRAARAAESAALRAFVDELPHTPTMKINKNALRQDKGLLGRSVDLGENTRRPRRSA